MATRPPPRWGTSGQLARADIVGGGVEFMVSPRPGWQRGRRRRGLLYLALAVTTLAAVLAATTGAATNRFDRWHLVRRHI